LPLLTPRLVLRTWRKDDLDSVALLNAAPDVMRYLGGVTARADSEAMLARMMAHWETRGFGVWAVEHRDGARAGEFAGLVGIMVPRWEAKVTPCVEILWRFKPTEWGKGLATEAARAALDDGFVKHDFSEVLSFTVQQNERSWRMMERLGMARSPEDDFDHPLVAEDDPLRRHIVYRITRETWAQRKTFSY
jgi:RimJ/RimL family protein N-acetyltransferase